MASSPAEASQSPLNGTDGTHTKSVPTSLCDAANTPLRDSALSSKRKRVKFVDPLKANMRIQTDDSGISFMPDGSFHSVWQEEDGYQNVVHISDDIVGRMRKDFTLPSISFRGYLTNYIHRKIYLSMDGKNPYTVHEDFYLLMREVTGATHELFADAINQSGVLPYYCSKDKTDREFGAQGGWEEVEDDVIGAVGHPPFEMSFLTKLVSKITENTKRGAPYCRVLLLPFEEGTRLHEMITDAVLGAEVVAIIDAAQWEGHIHHQVDFFRHGYERYRSQPFATCASHVCVAVWINEAYRIRNPPPNDVEECFWNWALTSFGSERVVDFNAVVRCFPRRCRSGRFCSHLLDHD